MSNVSGPHSRELKKRLASAREALAAGDGAGARCLTREALALDDTSYDAWVFDGKAAFFCGDVRDALKSYKVAAEIRDDHPAARRGAAPG
jgi:Tfp pilus assembly protein PilF